MCVPRTVARTAVLGQCAHVRCFIRPLTRYRQLSRTQNNFCSAFFVVVDVSFFFCCCSSTLFNALIPVYMFLPCSNVSYEDAMMVVKSARGHVWRNGAISFLFHMGSSRMTFVKSFIKSITHRHRQSWNIWCDDEFFSSCPRTSSSFIYSHSSSLLSLNQLWNYQPMTMTFINIFLEIIRKSTQIADLGI